MRVKNISKQTHNLQLPGGAPLVSFSPGQEREIPDECSVDHIEWLEAASYGPRQRAPFTPSEHEDAG